MNKILVLYTYIYMEYYGLLYSIGILHAMECCIALKRNELQFHPLT